MLLSRLRRAREAPLSSTASRHLRHRDGLGDGIQARNKDALAAVGLQNPLYVVPDGIAAAGDHCETHLLLI